MELGRKEPTHSAAMVGISSLDTGKQSRGWSSILDSPADVPRMPGMGWGALALQNNGLVMGLWQGPHLCE